MKETVCITGSSGGIGQALLERLTALYEVKALFRTKTEISDRWERRGCIPIWGDIRNENAMSALVAGAKFVFHCAAIVGQGSSDDAYAVNVEGTRRLARAAAQSGCQRFVYTSSVAVYSNSRGDKDFTEDTELFESEEMPIYALTKLQSERALQEVARETGLEYTILRPTSVYGPNTKPYTIIPVQLMLKGLPVMIGTGEGMLDVVYVDDVASALLLAAQCPRANGEVFNIGHETVTFNHFHSHYAGMLNRPARHVPSWMVRATAHLMERVPRPRKGSLRDTLAGVRFVVKMSENTKRFPATKAKALLGYAPRFTLSVGMLKTELWLKESHIISVNQYSLPIYGPLHFRPFAVVHAAKEEDLVDINQTALQRNARVRAIGALHSLSPIPETDGICIVLDQYNKLVKVDGPLVTVQAGMTIRELNEILAARNLALPTLGTITHQTVSGAISTATHGGSIYHGSLSDCVESVRIATPDGRIVDVDRSQELFAAVIVSLGLLGVISTVTFRCVPSCVLRSRSSVEKAPRVIENFDAMTRSSLYTCMFYFPVTDDIEILSIDKVENSGGDQAVQAPRTLSRKPKSAPNTIVGQRVAAAGLRSVAWLLLRHHSIQRFFTKFSVGSTYRTGTARSDLVLAFSDHLGGSGRSRRMLQDMEIAVPYEQAQMAISAIRNHFTRTRKYPLIPIHIRCSARSDLWLSPAYKRDVCYLEFWQYPRSDNLFREMHEVLKPFKYRFHWGKETRASQDYIKRQYERWDDFVRLREEWDPQGMFLNRYLESLFARSLTPLDSDPV